MPSTTRVLPLLSKAAPKASPTALWTPLAYLSHDAPSMRSLTGSSTTHPAFRIHQARRYASDSTDSTLSERLRRKIWGTDHPPGQPDPHATDGGVQPGSTEAEALSTSGSDATDELPILDADYTPAKTWDGLERIGGATGWWEEAWDREHVFQGFLRPSKVDARPEVVSIVRTVVQELQSLQAAGHPLEPVLEPPQLLDATNLESAEEVLDSQPVMAQKLDQVEPAQDAFDSRPVISEMNQVESALESPPSTSEAAILEPVESAISTTTWRNISLHDSAFKFSLLKRVMQLTGRHIPDVRIRQINTPQDLIRDLARKPKSKKLADLLDDDAQIAELPNVQVFHRRHTPIDKEKELGRWKVIEKALREKGLPVTGRFAD